MSVRGRSSDVPETGSLVSAAWWEDRRVKIPQRTVTDQYLARGGEHLGVVWTLASS
jgi:hypothetical protein